MYQELHISAHLRSNQDLSQIYFQTHFDLISIQFFFYHDCTVDNSKVVNLVSSVMIDNSMTTVSRQQGRRKLDYPCPTVMTKSTTRRWGQLIKLISMTLPVEGYFALLDCMLLNAWLGWNISCQQIPNRWELPRHEFYTYVAERMLNFKDDRGYCSRQQAPTPETIRLQHGLREGDTIHMPCPKKKLGQVKCLVCRLELGMKKSLGQKGLTLNVVGCTGCAFHCHSTVPVDSNRLIHTTFVEFENLTCHEIAHSPKAKGLWNMRDSFDQSTSVNHSHPIVKRLRVMHGLPERIKRKKGDICMDCRRE